MWPGWSRELEWLFQTLKRVLRSIKAPRGAQTSSPRQIHLRPARKVILLDQRTGLYYQGNCQWTRNRQQALDLRRSQNALKLAANFRLEAAEVILVPAAAPDFATPFRYPWWQN